MYKTLLTLIISIIFCFSVFAGHEFNCEKYQLPAIGRGLMIDGIIKKISVSGIRKVGSDSKVTNEDKWHIGSCTKSMTATLVASIISSGQYPSLTWKTTLKDIFDFDIHPNFKNITLQELLAHRSGIKDPKDWESLEQVLAPLKGDVIKIRSAVSEFFLTKAPAYDHMNTQKAHYSNIGYVIVGAILEKVTGKPWEQLISEKIFIPLGMTSAGFGSPANKNLQNPDQPWGHREKEVEKQIITIPENDDNPAWAGPAGIVHTSMEDWLKYINIHIEGYNGLNTKILPASAFHVLHRSIDNNSELNAGGWMIYEKDGFKVLAASGSNDLNTAIVKIYPELKSAIIFVTNHTTEEKIDNAFSDTEEWGLKYIKESRGLKPKSLKTGVLLNLIERESKENNF